MNRCSFLALAMFITAGSAGAFAQPSPGAKLKVTQSRLVPTCLDGRSTGDRRSWTLANGDHTMAVTMRNEPRPGVAAESVDSPGVAVVTFTLEAGHEYEVEVRAPPETFSRRVWEREQWTPVVRDRTVDRIVSSDPRWTGRDVPPLTGALPRVVCRASAVGAGYRIPDPGYRYPASSTSSLVTRPSSCWTTARTVEG